MGDIYAAAIEKRQTSGEVAELQLHHGLAANQIPIEMLRINVPSRNARRQQFRRVSGTPHNRKLSARYSVPATARFWASSGPWYQLAPLPILF